MRDKIWKIEVNKGNSISHSYSCFGSMAEQSLTLDRHIKKIVEEAVQSHNAKLQLQLKQQEERYEQLKREFEELKGTVGEDASDIESSNETAPSPKNGKYFKHFLLCRVRSDIFLEPSWETVKR